VVSLFDGEIVVNERVDPPLVVPVTAEPVMIEVVRACHFKAKPPEEVKGRKVKRRGCARCGLGKGDIAHMGAPPSFNALASGQGSGNAMVYAGLKARWQEVLTERLAATDLPKGLAHVLVEGEITFPDRGRRDQGNFRVIVEKALGDALVEGWWLADDSWDFYSFGNLEARYVKGESATRLYLFPTLP